MRNNLVLFSGGKDSMYALEKIAEHGEIVLVVSITSKEGDTQLHAGPEANQSFREAQVNLLNLPTAKIEVGNGTNYLNELYLGLKHLVKTRNIQHLITGDLWHPYTNGIGDMLAGALNIPIVRPSRDACPSREHGRDYTLELIKRGIESTIISVRDGNLPREFVGRTIDDSLVSEFERMGIDPAGESGEYQSIVNFSRLMNKRLIIDKYDITLVNGKNGKEKFHKMNIRGFHSEDGNRRY